MVRGSRSRAVIGQGGHRGAIVAAVEAPGFTRRALKEYLHPRCVPPNELHFMEAAVSLRRQISPMFQVSDSRTQDEDSLNYDFTLASHLVVPDAVVMDDSNHRGILMPMMSTNLHDFLVDTRPPEENSGCSPTDCGAFLLAKRFEPIASPRVITAILYQVVAAVATLQTQLPHKSQCSSECSGFSHNDLHLANLLVHYDTGAIVLCDFELVQHIPPSSGHHVIADRAPPLHRHPPQGLGLPSSDIWGVGLLAVDMLTGVVPFINEVVAKDDFGEGPLLLCPEEACGAAVIDWEANMAVHAYRCRGVLPGECPQTDALYTFCKTCLTNNEIQEAPNVSSLISHPLFDALRAEAMQLPGMPSVEKTAIPVGDVDPIEFGKAMCLSQAQIYDFVNGFAERRPLDRAKTIPRSSSSSSIAGSSVT